MKKIPSFQDELLISLSDLWLVCKKSKKIIAAAAAIGLVLGAWYSLRTPTRYLASGSFKDSSGGAKSIENKLQSIIGMSSDNSNTQGLMLSRQIMMPVIKDLGLQASLVEHNQGGFFHNVMQNIKLTYAYYKYTSRVRPGGGVISGKVIIPDKAVIEDQDLGVCCLDVSYEGEYFIPLKVHFIDEENYELSLSKRVSLGTFRLGEKVIEENYSFRLKRNSPRLLANRTFTLSLVPLSEAANSLVNDVVIKKDKENKNILRLTYTHSDRHLAAAVVNQVMLGYKKYLLKDHQRTVRSQLDYLEGRQVETSNHLEHMMSVHAQYLKDHLGDGGFIELEKEVEFVARNQAHYHSRLRDIDLNLQFIPKQADEDTRFFLHYFSGQPATQKLYEEYCELRQKQDVLTLALKHTSTETVEQQKAALHRQFERLKEIEADQQEIEGLLSSLHSENTFADYLRSVKPSDSLRNAWIEKLLAFENDSLESPTVKDFLLQSTDLKQHKEWFAAFLKNLHQQNSIEMKMIHEHIARQEGEETALLGIDLHNAHNLYLSYNNKQDQVQSMIRELEYLKTQVNRPDFELSALSSVLEDSVSLEIVKEAALLMRQLKDEKNRSPREQERIKTELLLSKMFLAVHLDQTKEIYALRETFIKEKIYSLQKVLLDLIQQKISLLNEQLAQHAEMQRKSLENEKVVIQKELADLNRSIAHLPEKWLAEERIELHTEMSLKMLQELASLVEAKNIAHDMEQLECMPLDFALATTLPLSPRLLFFMLVGAVGATFLCIGGLFGKTILEGVIASVDNLEMSGQHVSGTFFGSTIEIGTFARRSQENLSTLRQIISFLTSVENDEPAKGHTVLLFSGDGPDYSTLLCTFLAKRGDKVLKIDASFDRPSVNSALLPGVIQYVEGKAAHPTIHRQAGYDFIVSGGSSLYGVELIGSKAFNTLLEEAKQQYQWVILTTPYKGSNLDALGIVKQADQVLATLTNERLHEIKPLIDLINQTEHKRLSFIFSI